THPAEASPYDRFSSTSSECTGSSSAPPNFSGTHIFSSPSRCSASTTFGDNSPSISAYSASESSNGTSALAFSARMESSVSDSPSGMRLTPFWGCDVAAPSLGRDRGSGCFELGSRQFAATDDEQAQVDRTVEQE